MFVPMLRSAAKQLVLWGLAPWFRLLDSRGPDQLIVVFYFHPGFAPKAEAIADLLRRRGFPAAVRSGAGFLRRARVKLSPHLHIGYWSHYSNSYLPHRYIFLNAEPISAPGWREDPRWSEAMRGALQVWDYLREHEGLVTAHGVPFRYVPFGYAPYYEESFANHTRNKGLPTDIDVLFVGHVSSRRKMMLDRIAATGAAVTVVTSVNPVWGEQLDELLARSKVVVSIHKLPDPQAQTIDLARLDHLLASRRFVIHEQPSAQARNPEVEKYVVTCPYDDFPAMCTHYLARPAQRDEIVQRAYHWFKEAIALDDFLPYDDLRTFLAAGKP